MNKKFRLQESQYKKPYHHLLNINAHKFYDVLFWGLEYYSYVSFVIDYLSKYIKKNKIISVAEVGCGDGKIIFDLSKKFPNIIFHGFDLSKKAILFAKAYSFGLKNIYFFNKDFNNTKKKYDVILCIETLEHIPDNNIKTFLETIYNRLSNNGILILTVPSSNRLTYPKHYRHYDISLLKKQTKDFFKLKEIKFIHNFSSIFVRLINFFLINKIFILNSTFFRKKLFFIYDKLFKLTNEKSCAHIFVVFKKR